MSRINTTPKTLQDLLGNTAAGVNPSELLQEVRPSFDMFPLWAIDKHDFVTFNGSLAAMFQQQVIEVPEGEVWIPLAMSAELTSTVLNETFRIAIGIADRTNLIRVFHAESGNNPVTANNSEQFVAAYVWSQVQPVASGEFFFVQATMWDALAVAKQTTIDLKFIRLRA